jgi:group II intron reverse transcriptase/maturase
MPGSRVRVPPFPDHGNLLDLHARVHRGAYRALPVRRRFIPKPGGKQRPLGIAALEGKIVQRAVVTVLNAIYEEDFLGFSYGFRPGRSQHDALDALSVAICDTPVNWILDADIRGFFGSLDHGCLLRFLEERVGDPRIISLIRCWLKAGILEEGELTANEQGTPQGGSISVLLSNLYLHQVLDLWFEQQVKPRLRGEAYLIRYIDDFVICFQFREDAERVQTVLSKRLNKFELAVEPSKTKLVKFGRFAPREACVHGKRPETFSFLGFTHYGTRNRKGTYKVGRKTEKSRLRRSMVSLTALMRDIRHWSLKDQVCPLNQVLRGHYAYYGLAGNWRSLHKVYRFAERYWHKMLCSRSWAAMFTWEVFHRLRDRFPLQRPTISLTYGEMKACAVL